MNNLPRRSLPFLQFMCYSTTMFDRIKALFESAETSDNQEMVSSDELQLAAAALLVEAASVDGDFDTLERQSIHTIMETHFNLSVGFTRVVKDRYDDGDRIKMIEMLWEVAFSDGRADAFEKNLIQRVAGLIFVSDKDRGLARKRVMARLGIGG
ncbi:MAG TPA: TerB family tellurite resistance protein [Rhodospirillales bacterium]|nr:TerB family tellurite resistance protein [Rhodospirillales bacterium]